MLFTSCVLNFDMLSQISVGKFDSFMARVEEGYGRHRNPYHNSCHGADVAQTLHSVLKNTGFEVVNTTLGAWEC